MAVNRTLQRRLAFGSNATLVTVLVVGMVVLGWLISDKYRVRIDLSADQGSSLLADTRNKLRLLDHDAQPVTITAFSAQRGKQDAFFKDRQLSDLMEELDYNSPAVTAHFVDFDRDRLTAESLHVTDYGTVVIQRGEQRVDISDRDLFRRVGKGDDKRLDFLGEAAINRGFSQLLSDTRRTVYALVGHGEMAPDSRDPSGLADLAQALDQEHYALKPLDLVRGRKPGDAPRVPDDAAAVLIVRPTVAIPAGEEDVLLSWFSGGGALLFAVDPEGMLPDLLGRFGVAVPSGYVLDKVLLYPYPDRPVPRYRSHAITQTLLEDDRVTWVSRAAPVQAGVPMVTGVRSSSLLETSRDGWIERGGPVIEGQAAFQEGVDGAGPASMALALEVSSDSGLVRKKAGRVVVLGDADMVSNAVISEGPGNMSFAVNSVRWLLGDDERMSVVGRPSAVRRLTLTDEDRGRIQWLAMGISPFLVLLAAGGVWASRRGR
jgi:hypothetical protein